MENPVIQIIDESNNEIVYTIRANSSTYRPKVFREGYYTIIIGEPGTEKVKTLEKIHSIGIDEKKELTVVFE